MTDDPHATAQRVVGWVASVAFVGLAYLSMSPDYTLTWPVIIGVIVVIAMLLGKLNALADLVEQWRR